MQRRATKLLMETTHITYTQQIEYLDLPALCHRRHRGDMIQIFQIINVINDINCETIFEFGDYDGTINSLTNYIYNMLVHKAKK